MYFSSAMLENLFIRFCNILDLLGSYVTVVHSMSGQPNIAELVNQDTVKISARKLPR